VKVIRFETENTPSDVYLDGSIDVIFDADIDSSTVNLDNVYLYILPNYIRYTATLSVDAEKLTLDFNSVPLKPNLEWQIILTSGASGIKSSVGDSLTENELIEFTTQTTVSPEAAEDAESLEEKLNTDYTTEALTGTSDVNQVIVIPDTTIQGDVATHTPCSPDFGAGIDTSELIIEGSGIGSGILTFIGSIPREYSVGIWDVSEVTIVYNEAIEITDSSVTPNPVEMSWQDMPYPLDPFTHELAEHSGLPVIVNDRIISTYLYRNDAGQLELIDPINKEFTVKVKAGKMTGEDSGTVNVTQTVHFIGPLEPMLCTFDMAKTRAGMWDVEWGRKSIYHYTKLIHEISIQALTSRGYSDISEASIQDITELSRFVCCYTALQMLAYGIGDEASTGSSSSGVFVKRRDLPGVSITYERITGGGNGVLSAEENNLKILEECVKNAGVIQDSQFENISIKHGVKSYNDSSYIGRRRL